MLVFAAVADIQTMLKCPLFPHRLQLLSFAGHNSFPLCIGLPHLKQFLHLGVFSFAYPVAWLGGGGGSLSFHPSLPSFEKQLFFSSREVGSIITYLSFKADSSAKQISSAFFNVRAECVSNFLIVSPSSNPQTVQSRINRSCEQSQKLQVDARSLREVRKS